jgi:RNA polymerase subunit RPABC4/transcription elongation factor Spt4
MAIIKCPECGGMVSDTAKVCPHCGFAIGKLNGPTKLVIKFGSKASSLAQGWRIAIKNAKTDEDVVKVSPYSSETVELDISEPISIYAKMAMNPKSDTVVVKPHETNRYEVTAAGMFGMKLKLVPIDINDSD